MAPGFIKSTLVPESCLVISESMHVSLKYDIPFKALVKISAISSDVLLQGEQILFSFK